MSPHSITFAQKIPWTEEPDGLQSMGSLESDTTERLHFHFSLSCTGEGNGNPLQCYCLENPRDGGAWWAAVYGVAQSRTGLKRLSSSSSSSSIYWIGAGGVFWSSGNVLYFDQDCGYMGKYLCKNSLSSSFKIYTLYFNGIVNNKHTYTQTFYKVSFYIPSSPQK